MALRLHVDNWRWMGVPFYLRGGKRLPRRATEIVVTLRRCRIPAFRQDGAQMAEPNQLILAVQPNEEGISLSLATKVPGARMQIRPVNMEFLYGTAFMSQSPEAYERLILDTMRGDATLFTRADEVEAALGDLRPDPPALGGGRPRPAPLLVRLAGPRGGGHAARPRVRRLEASLDEGAAAPTTQGFWSAEDTSPVAIEAALERLLNERAEEGGRAYAPARVLNLIVAIDPARRTETIERLESVGRVNPSRTLLMLVEEGANDARRMGHDGLRGADRGWGAGRVPGAGRAPGRERPPAVSRLGGGLPARGRPADRGVVAARAGGGARRPAPVADVVLIDSSEPPR